MITFHLSDAQIRTIASLAHIAPAQTSNEPAVPCGECGEEVDPLDMHAGYGMCGSCVHNAVRSGWDPSEPEAA